MIRCVRCNRILRRSAIEVRVPATTSTPAGVRCFGPACAVHEGLLPEPMRIRVMVRRRPARASAQIELMFPDIELMVPDIGMIIRDKIAKKPAGTIADMHALQAADAWAMCGAGD